MFFHAPMWLMLLGPWVALVIWALRGRFPQERVPFLPLWGEDRPREQRPARASRRPPAAIMTMLAALLLGILGAAEPILYREAAHAKPAGRIYIESLAVRDWPTAQAMMRIGNDSAQTQGRLSVTTGNDTTNRTIVLPSRGATRDYFIDLPSVGTNIRAEVAAGSLGNELETASPLGWPAIEARGSLPRAVNRMVMVYTRDRAPDSNSRQILVTRGDGDMASEKAAVIVMAARGKTLSPQTPVIVMDDPVTRDMDWQTALAEGRGESPRGGGWEPLVTTGDVVVLAVRRDPVRQVWIGFDSDAFARRPDFVTFWTGVINWLGGTDSWQELATAHSVAPSTAKSDSSPPVSLAGQTLAGALAAVALAAILASPKRSAPRNSG